MPIFLLFPTSGVILLCSTPGLDLQTPFITKKMQTARNRQMSRSLAAVVLILVALVAAMTTLAEPEDLKLAEDGSVSPANATDIESSGNNTRTNWDTFIDMIDNALKKEFTENEDHNEANDVGSFNKSVAEQQDNVGVKCWCKA